MRRTINAKRSICLLFTALMCFGTLFGCNAGDGAQSTDTQSSASDVENAGAVSNDATIGGCVWNLGEGAAYSDGTLTCGKGSVAVCSDKNLPGSYILECDITTTKSSYNGIVINSMDNDGYHVLAFNSNRDEITIKKFIADKIVTVSNVSYNMDEGYYHVKLVVGNSSLKLFVSKTKDEDAGYQIIDVLIDKYRPNTLSFVSEDAEMSVKNIELRENDMTLSANERYINPVATGADPYILYHDGMYYLYSTNAVNSGYKVFTSANLKTWEDRGLCLKTADVYGEPTSSAGFWAPEVYNYNGKFYLIYTVNEHLGIAVADSPLGPFVSPKQSYINNNKKEIDGHLFFDDDGKVYIYFVRCGSDVGPGKGNEIFAAEFDMETFTYKNERCILYPENKGSWEWLGNYGYVAEGPAILKHEGRYYLTYSANGYTSQNYAIGLAISDSPLGTYVKYKNNPILEMSKTNNVYGPGHHAFTYSPDGTELFIVYHRHASATSVHSRVTCIDRAYFTLDEKLGYDVLRVVGPTSTAQPLPSGMKK